MHTSLNTDLLKTLGENIRKHRVLQKMSQSQLAFETGTSLRQIQRLEKGEYHAGILYYINICNCLNISIMALLDSSRKR